MANLSYLQLVRRQRRGAPPLTLSVSLVGKVVMVVGANVGIGLETVKHFAAMNPHRIIMGCRNGEKGRVAKQEVETATGYKGVELRQVDLSSFSSVVGFANAIINEGSRLDILVMNAAVSMFRYEEVEGWESTLHVNHLSAVLLSLLLLPHMIRSAEENGVHARLVVVSSDMHYQAQIPEENVTSSKMIESLNSYYKSHFTRSIFQGRGPYETSKLFNVFFVRALTARLDASLPIVATSVNPGYCTSKLRRNLPWPASLFDHGLEAFMAWTPEEGSRQLVWAALGPGEGQDDRVMKGEYIECSAIKEVSDFVLSEKGRACQDRIWDETVDILKKVAPEIDAIVQRYINIGPGV